MSHDHRCTSNAGAPRRAVGRLKPPFVSFCEAVRDLLDETAAEKGHQQAGLTGPNPLYVFVAETAGEPGHALGEIIYKVRRYVARGNPEDLVKVAAWAYLVWRFDRPDDRYLDEHVPPTREEGQP